MPGQVAGTKLHSATQRAATGLIRTSRAGHDRGGAGAATAARGGGVAGEADAVGVGVEPVREGRAGAGVGVLHGAQPLDRVIAEALAELRAAVGDSAAPSPLVAVKLIQVEPPLPPLRRRRTGVELRRISVRATPETLKSGSLDAHPSAAASFA